eukprot:scaffold77199_cov68-Phaeocystis_antarctica.AAC.4
MRLPHASPDAAVPAAAVPAAPCRALRPPPPSGAGNISHGQPPPALACLADTLPPPHSTSPPHTVGDKTPWLAGATALFCS